VLQVHSYDMNRLIESAGIESAGIESLSKRQCDGIELPTGIQKAQDRSAVCEEETMRPSMERMQEDRFACLKRW